MRFRFWALPVFLGFLFLSVTAQRANADTFNVSWSGVYGDGSGTITAADLGGGIFQITSMDATQDGLTLSLLPQFTFGVNGNFIYPSATPQLDDLGFGFLAGTTEYNIYFDDSVTQTYRECSSVDTACSNFGDGAALNSFSITTPTVPAPEPGSLVLLGTGLIGLAGIVRKKRSA